MIMADDIRSQREIETKGLVSSAFIAGCSNDPSGSGTTGDPELVEKGRKRGRDREVKQSNGQAKRS